MMVLFKKVRWKNFLSTGNAFNEVVLNQNKTTLLMGPSGSGKSTLLDAISFALFDKPFRSINKDKVVNTINEKNCLVEIEFTIGNREYLIRRGRKPNIFEILVDGTLLNQDAAAKDYQKHLEKQILKFNFKSFTQIVVLGASNFTPFMQLKPQDRRTIIENLLDIEVFTVMNVLLKEMGNTLKEDVKENLSQIDLTNHKIKLHEKFIEDLEKDHQQKIIENQEKVEQNKKTIQKLDEQITELKSSISTLQTSLELEQEIQGEMDKLLKIESKIEQNLKKTQKELDFYSDHDDCPTCKQQIAAEFKECEVSQKTKKIGEFKSALEQIDDKLKKISVKQDEFKKIHQKIDGLMIEVRKHESSKFAVEEYIKKIDRELKEMLKPKANIEDERQTLITLAKEVETLEQNKVVFAAEKNLNDLAANLLKDSGVKAQIIKQYLPVINKKINQHLQEMNFFITFHIDENFNEFIKARGRDDLCYANFSEGEKQRIDLALLFTWRAIAKLKNSVNTNLLILDEVFDSYLDNQATENVLQLLNSKMFSDVNIFVISHKETISDKFDSTIKFSKQKNFSIIEP